MIAVSLNVGIDRFVHMHAKHYKHNADGRAAPVVCGNGSVPLSHSGNVVTRIGIHTDTHTFVFLSALKYSLKRNKYFNSAPYYLPVDRFSPWVNMIEG